MVLTLLPLMSFLMAAIPANGQIVGNTLSLSDSSAPAGEFNSVLLHMANENSIGGIQADILFDSNVAAFVGVVQSGQGLDFITEGQVVEPGRLRIIMYIGDTGGVGSDTREIATLTFSMQGETDDSTALTFQDIILADQHGEAVPGSGNPGSLTVSAPEEPPTLSIAALKNPGNTHIVMIMVTVIGGSGSAPTVSASGSAVAMTSLGDGIFQGQHHALSAQSTLTITATDTNSHGTGNAQVILALP